MAGNPFDPGSKERADPTLLRPPGAPIEQNMASVLPPAPPPPAVGPTADAGADDDAVSLASVPRTGRSFVGWMAAVLIAGAAGAAWHQFYRPLALEAGTLRAQATKARSELEESKQEIADLEARVRELNAAQSQLAQTVEEKEKALAELERVQGELTGKLEAEIKRGDVLLKQVKGELVMDLNDKIMFDSGASELNDSGKDVLKRVSETLLKLDKVIQIGGHTDDVPISDKLKEKFPTNWDLSAARAINVVRFLHEECKMPGKRLVATGFAEYRPTSSNRTSSGRRKNRRIEVTLLERR